MNRRGQGVGLELGVELSMEPRRSHRVTFSGHRNGRYPLLWAQQKIVSFVHGSAANASKHMNIARWGCFWSGPVGTDEAVAAVTEVVGAHEALRTTIEVGAGQVFTQIVHGAGELTIDEYPLSGKSPDEATRQVAHLLTPRPFGADELPVRVALVTRGGKVFGLALAFNHTCVDGDASALVRDEIMRIALRGPGQARDSLQLGEIAEFERSPDQQRHTARAGRYFRSVFQAVADNALPPRRPGLRDHREWQVASRDMAVAAKAIADNNAVTVPVVIIASYAKALGEFLGITRPAFWILSGNRVLPRLANAVANLAQPTVIAPDLAQSSFDRLCAHTLSQSVQALRFGRYEPSVLAGAAAEANISSRIPFSINIRPYNADLPFARSGDAADEVPPAAASTYTLASGVSIPPFGSVKFDVWRHREILSITFGSDLAAFDDDDLLSIMRNFEETLLSQGRKHA